MDQNIKSLGVVIKKLTAATATATTVEPVRRFVVSERIDLINQEVFRVMEFA